MSIRHIGRIVPAFCACCLTCKYRLFFWIGEKKVLLDEIIAEVFDWAK